jgi:signal peptidase I
VWEWLVAGLVVATGLALMTRAVRRRFAVIVVSGPSMQPALQPGDRALVRRGGRSLSTGDIVVFHEPPSLAGQNANVGPVPAETWVVKRVAARAGDLVPSAVLDAVSGEVRVPAGKLVVLGDNRAMSRDSRLWGFISEQAVLGRTVRTLHGTGLPSAHGSRSAAGDGAVG